MKYPGEKIIEKDGSRGFTLIEVMVAMAVLFIGFTGVAQMFSGGLRISRKSDDYMNAAIFARSKMEMMFAADSLEVGEDEGDFDDRFGWTSTVTLIDDDNGNGNGGEGVKSGTGHEKVFGRATFKHYHLTLEVFWPSSAPARNLKLEGMRVVMSHEGMLF